MLGWDGEDRLVTSCTYLRHDCQNDNTGQAVLPRTTSMYEEMGIRLTTTGIVL